MKKIIISVVLAAVAVSYGDITVGDDFNRADGSLGANWTLGATGFAIDGNSVTFTNNPSNDAAWWNANAIGTGADNDFSVSLDVAMNTTASTAWAGVAFNVQDADNFYTLRYSAGGEVQFLRVVGGSVSAFLNQTGTEFTHVQNRTYRLEVTSDTDYVYSGSVTDTTDDSVVWSFSNRTDTLSKFTGGYAGIYTGINGSESFDNFSLTVVPEPATLGLVAFSAFVLMALRRIRS